MTRVRLLFLVFTLLVPTMAQAEQTLFRIHGSNTVGAKLAPELIDAWLRTQGYTEINSREFAPQESVIRASGGGLAPVRIELKAHGSSTSFKALQAGEADIGMSSRPIKDKEVDALRRYGDMRSKRSEYVVGLDGIAVIVHPSNPLRALNKDVIADIFAGRTTDWSQLGGPRGTIHVYARDDKSGTYDTFRSLVLGKKTPLVSGAKRYESNADLSDDVSRDPQGIGFVGLPYVRQSRALVVADGEARPIAPQAFAVATEDYALARRLFLYVPSSNANPAARAFADFAVSRAGQNIVDQVGFVSQRIIEGEVKLSEEEGYPEEYLHFTEGARRLSLNFRFNAGSIELDNKAHRDLERLVEYMRDVQNRDRQVMLLGFSDANEVLPIHAIELSISRADIVADTLIRNGIDPMRVRGYGAAVPVASNEEIRGRNKNRRVEVWVR
jgi:phosphate transport system substrate-binding protein